MKEHIKILNEFLKHPLGVLENEKDNAKLIAAINKSIKLLHKEEVFLYFVNNNDTEL